MSERAFPFLRVNEREGKPRTRGITENVKTWRTDVAAKIIDTLGLEQVMFEAADPEVFAWYIKNYGAEVNLFVDHGQIVQLECLRSGVPRACGDAF